MNIRLTEATIRQRASAQSYQRGREYYQIGAISDPSWQEAGDGIVLMGHCEGGSGNEYSLRVTLDATGIQSTACTCPYDWGGDCKHIIALLLTYLHQRDEFTRRESLPTLLEGIDRDGLLTLLNRLVENNPDLYDEIELALPLVYPRRQPQPDQTTQPGVAAIWIAPSSVSEQMVRKQVKRILKDAEYEDDYGEYDEWEGAPAYLEDLEKIQQTAEQLLTAGDAEGAITMLRVLLDETVEVYDSDMDYDGALAGFIQDLGITLTEAILSVTLEPSARVKLQAWMEDLLEEVDEDAIETSALEIVLAALKYGWADPPGDDDEIAPEAIDENDLGLLDDLQHIKLNLLERQGRTDEFLKLAEAISPLRYVIKLIDIGQVSKAIALSRQFESDLEILPVAKRLYEIGRTDDALALAERNLQPDRVVSYNLGEWLAPIEESLGKKELALLAYRSVYLVQPSIQGYLKIKQLAGMEFEKYRPELFKKAGDGFQNLQIQIHLEEHEWDAAIRLAEKNTWQYDQLVEVADAVIHHRPDWVIRIAIKQAEDLIKKTQSKLYPAAAGWLKRAKQAYHHKGQGAEWQVYIRNLRAEYARRPALQKAIADL